MNSSQKRFNSRPLCSVFLALCFVFCQNISFGNDKNNNGKHSKDFLHAHGTKLCLNGKEYRQISFNVPFLLFEYLDIGWEHQRGSKPNAKKKIKELGERKFKLIRIMGPFYSAWYNEVFFDKDKNVEKQKRDNFFKIFDEMLDDLDEYNIKIIFSPVWNIETLADFGGHSLYEGLVNPESVGYKKYIEFVGEVARRYKNRKTVAAWEVPGNEWDLFTNQQAPDGVFQVRDGAECLYDENGRRLCSADSLAPGVIVRDKRNNISAFDLAIFSIRVANDVRKIDPNHMVVSGHSSGRENAMHLLEAFANGNPPDWGRDSPDQREDHIRITHYGLDAVSVHHYESADDGNIKFYKNVAFGMGKPLIIGEVGPDGFKKPRDMSYTSAESLNHLEKILDAVIENEVPITLFWVYGDDRIGKKDMDFQLRYGLTDEALALIESANKKIQEKTRPE
ncbi:MAG: hypothetical protein Q8Q06_02645 [bacterium]|nr:hypothetical protein [bacterium]